jgi:hypothetical protein
MENFILIPPVDQSSSTRHCRSEKLAELGMQSVDESIAQHFILSDIPRQLRRGFHEIFDKRQKKFATIGREIRISDQPGQPYGVRKIS